MSRSRKVKTVSRCMWARSLVITAAITRSAAPLAKRFLAICSIMRAWRALAHADQHRAVADGHHIAAFQRGLAEVLGVEAAVVALLRVPELEVGILEHRVVAVDRQQVERFLAPGRPVHRVDRDAVEDPARGVAREERIRHRRQHKVARIVQRGRAQRDLFELARDPDPSRRRSGRRPGAWPARPASCSTGTRALRPPATSRRCTRRPPARSSCAGPRRWPPAPRPAGPAG